MSSQDGINNGSSRIRFPHAHKKTFDEVHLGGGEMAQQVSNFPLGLKRWLQGENARGPQQENMEELSGLDLKVMGDILESPH